jgi:integrase/recombinase XerD
VPVPGRAAAALDIYLTDARPELVKRVDQALFISRHGGRLSLMGLRAIVRRHGRAIGLDVSPHALRHTCATHLLRGGASIRHVQELLGHRSLATTALYTSVAIKDLREVLARAHPRR